MLQQHLDLFKRNPLYIESAQEEHPICHISPPVHHKVHVRALHSGPPTMLGSLEELIIHRGIPPTPAEPRTNKKRWSNSKNIHLDFNVKIKLCHISRMCVIWVSAEGALHGDVGTLLEDSTLPLQTSKLQHLPLVKKLCSSL